MDCPECKEGKIRVMKIVCTCGHSPMMCDKCLKCFSVKCGPPYGEKFPPEYPMEFDAKMTESLNETIQMCGTKKDFITKEIDNMPLLES